MGGKRFDQYRIAPDEAGATDYKSYPNKPGERAGDKSAIERGSESQPIKPDIPAPEKVKER